MQEIIGAIASIIEIATKNYSSGSWVQQKKQSWKVPSSLGVIDKNIKLFAEYYPLTSDRGFCREFRFGRESLSEEKRLIHDKTRLIKIYYGITEKLLVAKHIDHIPYEVVTPNLIEVGLDIQDKNFLLSPALKDIYYATDNVIEQDRSAGFQEEPKPLVRACNWNENRLTVEKTEYAEAVSTNMIADLDLKTTFGETTLLENNLGTINTIRDYDLSLSDNIGYFPSFRKSSLANPIGVAAIAITADNKLILVHRSHKVSAYANKLGPSSSGYLTWLDVQSRSGDSLNSILVKGLQREIAEELYLDTSQEISELYPLGLFREFYRAGMPQAFYCFRINLTTEKLVSRIRDAQDFRECIGIFSISVNRQALLKIITTLVRVQKVGKMEIGLEVQGLLTALASYGADLLFS